MTRSDVRGVCLDEDVDVCLMSSNNNKDKDQGQARGYSHRQGLLLL